MCWISGFVNYWNNGKIFSNFTVAIYTTWLKGCRLSFESLYFNITLIIGSEANEQIHSISTSCCEYMVTGHLAFGRFVTYIDHVRCPVTY